MANVKLDAMKKGQDQNHIYIFDTDLLIKTHSVLTPINDVEY